jgi:hypothetical protein
MITLLKKLFARGDVVPPTPAAAPSREDAPLVFARIFAGSDGARALAYLRLITFRAGGPEASDGALRYYDGQRGLVQTIQGLVDQGRG